MALLLGAPASPVGAFVCGPTGSNPETNSKLQIFISGDRVNETQWAFTITPNPFTLGGSLRVVDNQGVDINRSLNDLLLEDVCTSTVGESYTVTLDLPTPPPCPLVQNSLTRSGPGPTASLSDPQTAAFYFIARCLTPTPIIPTATPLPPTPTLTPISPTATPSLPTVTPTPYGPSALSVYLSPQVLPCQGSGVITVSVTGDPDAEVVLGTSAGVITPLVGRAYNGLLIARLDLAGLHAVPSSNIIVAKSGAASAGTPFTTSTCADVATPTVPTGCPSTASATISAASCAASTPIVQYLPYFIPGTNQYYLQAYPPAGPAAPNGQVVVTQQQQQSQPPSSIQQPPANGQAYQTGSARISPPSTGEVDWLDTQDAVGRTESMASVQAGSLHGAWSTPQFHRPWTEEQSGSCALRSDLVKRAKVPGSPASAGQPGQAIALRTALQRAWAHTATESVAIRHLSSDVVCDCSPDESMSKVTLEVSTG